MVSLPMELMSCTMRSRAPSPRAITDETAAMPITIPRTVNPACKGFLTSHERAIFIASSQPDSVFVDKLCAALDRGTLGGPAADDALRSTVSEVMQPS